MSVLLNFLYSQFFVTPPYPKNSFAGEYRVLLTPRAVLQRDPELIRSSFPPGKTVIVTGSNVGLGLEAARHIARLGASKLILAVRDTKKGAAAKSSIESSTKCAPGVIEVWNLDLSSYDNVKAFAAKATAELPRIDAVIENAGVATDKYKKAEDNELTITTNVVSTFLLAFLLLPKLKETAQKHNVRPNLVIVSSEVHFFTPFKERNAAQGQIFNTLNDEKTANMADRYQVSKLLEVFACRQMAKLRPADSYPVTINFLNPGLCHSELARDAGMGLAIMKFFLARTTEVGSRTLVHAADAGPESHGEYLSDCKVTPTAPLTRSEEGAKVQERVYDELVERLEKIEPGVTKNL